MGDDKPIALAEGTRKSIALLVVGLAVVHLLVPTLAIDGVFLGLIALAGVVLLFDIESVEALGVRATARRLRQAATDVAAAEIVSEVPASPNIVPPAPAGLSANTQPASPQDETQHREPDDLMPPVEPVARLLWAAEQIRIELIVLAGSNGVLPQRVSWGAYRTLEIGAVLAKHNRIPHEFVSALSTVVDTRNKLAHGAALPPAVLLSADELAMTMLSRLREMPREYHRIEAYPVDLFTDQSLTTRHVYLGVMVENRDRDGRITHTGVYPTLQNYTRGRFVTWEWDFSHGSDVEAWYFDGKQQRAVAAFSSAAAFAGREFPDQWGLRYRGGDLFD